MKILTPLALSGLLFTALPVMAESNTPGALPQTGVKICAPGAKFGLTSEQKDKLNTLHDQFKLSTAQKKAELEVAMHQQRELMGKTVIDKSAVLSLQTKINSLRDELANARIEMALNTSSVFTPEQREMFQKRMGRGGGKFGGHKPGGWGHHKGGFEQRKVG